MTNLGACDVPLLATPFDVSSTIESQNVLYSIKLNVLYLKPAAARIFAVEDVVR
jgi:hypothetical protein